MRDTCVEWGDFLGAWDLWRAADRVSIVHRRWAVRRSIPRRLRLSAVGRIGSIAIGSTLVLERRPRTIIVILHRDVTLNGIFSF